MTGSVTDLSLDHDLGNDRKGTGYDVITWLEKAVVEYGLVPPNIKVHSANVPARPSGFFLCIKRSWLIWIEHLPSKQTVIGSNPIERAKYSVRFCENQFVNN